MHTILIAGAALVGLPVLLHLIMKQEPKRLTFPAFRFLKQKLKTNQRKLRLRHFVLLALRMLLIALFCLTLYQPSFKSDRLNIRGEQPVAAVLVLDTTPSMGYVANDKTRLQEATQRAAELLKELPEGSRVAVVDTAELSREWGAVRPARRWRDETDVTAARRRIEDAKEARGGAPVTSGLKAAYELLATVDKDTDAQEPLPKLVVVFTDRTAASWDATHAEDLKKLRDALPDPKPVHVVIDFGIDAPTDVGILAAEMHPQIIPANQTAGVTVSVGTTGGGTSVGATVIAKPLWAAKPESFTGSREVAIPAGQTRTAAFEFRDLQPGLHQIEFSLKAPDKLEADNKRYLTFKVGAARRILTITDDRGAAAFWQAAHAVKDEFSCLVVTPEQVEVGDGGAAVVRYAPDPAKPDAKVSDDLRAFEVVALLDVVNPHATNPARPADGTLWDRLRPYLRAGGKLIVMPGPDTNTDATGYNVANDIMPGQLKKPVIDTRRVNPPPPPQTAPSWPGPRDGKNGVTWVFDDSALKHPMLRVVEEWRQQKANLDILANPRTVRKFWPVEPGAGARAVVYYNDAAKPADRHPAILERSVRDKDGRERGKVLLLTTRMDVMPNDDQWNDYWEEEGSTWFAAFPYLLVRYLAGDTADANFNFPTGARVSVPVPRSRVPRDAQVVLDGPGISGRDSVIKLTESQAEVHVGPPQTNRPGNFALSAVRPDNTPIWKDGFSVNIPAEESNLDKVPVPAIEELTGKGRVFPIDRNTTLHDWLNVALGQPVEMFPYLLIAVLLLFAAEGLIANRFYRRARP